MDKDCHTAEECCMVIMGNHPEDEGDSYSKAWS